MTYTWSRCDFRWSRPRFCRYRLSATPGTRFTWNSYLGGRCRHRIGMAVYIGNHAYGVVWAKHRILLRWKDGGVTR